MNNIYDRLTVLRLPAIVGVAFIHAYETNINLASGTFGVVADLPLSTAIRELLSQGLVRAAVPILFWCPVISYFSVEDEQLKYTWKN